MNKIEEFIKYYNKDNINISPQHLTKEKNRLKTIFKEYELNNSIKKTPLLKTFLMYCDLTNNNEPEPERKQQNTIIQKEPDVYYINYPSFKEYMEGKTQKENGKMVSPNEILEDVHFTARPLFLESMRQQWKKDYPFQNKFVRYKHFQEFLGEKNDRIDYLEQLLEKNKIQFETDDY